MSTVHIYQDRNEYNENAFLGSNPTVESWKEGLRLDNAKPPKPLRYYRIPRAIFALIMTGGSLFAMVQVGCHFAHVPLSTLPHKILPLFKRNLPVWKTATIGGSAALTVGAVSLIIYKAIYGKDKPYHESNENALVSDEPKAAQGRGKFFGDQHYKPAMILKPMSIRQAQGKKGKSEVEMVYVDTSMLKGEPPSDNFGSEVRSGTLFSYAVKGDYTSVTMPGLSETDTIATLVFVATPLWTAGKMIYNIVRAPLILIYCSFQYLREQATGKKIFDKHRKFCWYDGFVEGGKSIWNAVKAPFYGIALMCAAAYTYFDPMGGRKLGRYIEYDWNGQIDRDKGCWSVNGKMKNWDAFSKRWGPGNFDAHPAYLPGCWQPFHVLKVDKGSINSVTTLGSQQECNIYFKPIDITVEMNIPDYAWHPNSTDHTNYTIKQQALTYSGGTIDFSHHSKYYIDDCKKIKKREGDSVLSDREVRILIATHQFTFTKP